MQPIGALWIHIFFFLLILNPLFLWMVLLGSNKPTHHISLTKSKNNWINPSLSTRWWAVLGADSVPVDGLNLRTQLSMGHKIFTLSFFLPCSGSISSTVNSKWKPSLYLHVAEEAVSWSEDECGVHWSLHNAIFYPEFCVAANTGCFPPGCLPLPGPRSVVTCSHVATVWNSKV